MIIYAIDPGTIQSGWVLYDGVSVIDSGVHDNNDLLRWIQAGQGADVLAIEMIAAMGMAVGREVFETIRWIGRYQQAWRDPEAVRFVYRREVKTELCGNQQAKDANVRAALLDRVGPTGTKRAPGPTYGVRSHAWQALGVAVTAEALQRAGAEQATCPSATPRSGRLGPPGATAGHPPGVSTPLVGPSGPAASEGNSARTLALVAGPSNPVKPIKTPHERA